MNAPRYSALRRASKVTSAAAGADLRGPSFMKGKGAAGRMLAAPVQRAGSFSALSGQVWVMAVGKQLTAIAGCVDHLPLAAAAQPASLLPE